MQHKVYFKHTWLNELWERKVPFFATFYIIVTLSYGALYALDFYPELKTATSTPQTVTGGVAVVPTRVAQTPAVVKPVVTTPVVTTEVKSAAAVSSADSLPVRLIIDKLNKSVVILNPKETTVEALDAALLNGAARHPESADFKKTGTMFLLGHSSYLPFVHNKNYQAFNGIQNLEWGDLIRVQSSNTEYLYRVQKVSEAKASKAEVDISWGTPKLVLATCNSFGTKDDRYVVEANFIESYPIGSKKR